MAEPSMGHSLAIPKPPDFKAAALVERRNGQICFAVRMAVSILGGARCTLSRSTWMLDRASPSAGQQQRHQPNSNSWQTQEDKLPVNCWNRFLDGPFPLLLEFLDFNIPCTMVSFMTKTNFQSRRRSSRRHFRPIERNFACGCHGRNPLCRSLAPKTYHF
jgi:hypothetical protein